MDVWSSLLPVLGLIAGAGIIGFLVMKNGKKNREKGLRVDPLSNLFVDADDRQEDTEE